MSLGSKKRGGTAVTRPHKVLVPGYDKGIPGYDKEIPGYCRYLGYCQYLNETVSAS